MKFRPCIDIHEGKVKQIVGSSLGSELKVNFETQKSAIDFAKIFAKYELSGGHICVLDRSEDSLQLAKSVTRKYKNWQIGGGINEETAQEYVEAGADKVIVSSALFEGNDVFTQAKLLSQKIGKENLVLDLSCKSFNEIYYVMKDGWQTQTQLEVTVGNLEELSQFCSEFLIHGISVEGKNAGFDEKLVRILTEFKKHKVNSEGRENALGQNNFPITYAGGLGSLADIKYFKKLSEGFLDFTIGSSLDIYGGALDLKKFLTQ